MQADCGFTNACHRSAEGPASHASEEGDSPLALLFFIQVRFRHVLQKESEGLSFFGVQPCSRSPKVRAPITWQVDRTCHVISARSWDHMCKLMLEQADDMEADVHPHGSRKLVAGAFSSDTVY